MTTDFTIVARRLCRIRGAGDNDDTPFPLDEAGFLDKGSIPEVADLTPGALVLARAAAAAGAFVLLGEPGLGKTTVFNEILSPDESADSTVLRIDGAALSHETFEDYLGRHLDELPPSAEGEGADVVSRLVIVLDQADESPIVSTLARMLRQRMLGRSTRHVRFLVACRTADYPASLTSLLAEVCGTCVLADLAPLTREDAVELCNSIDGADGQAIVDAATSSGAGALASVPLTLNLLVRTFIRTGSLDETPAKLFELGIRELLDEPAADRAEPFTTTTDQRLAVAGRIAARQVLSGSKSIWTGRALDAAAHDLGDDSIVGGREKSRASEFEVTKQSVRETLGCALFTGRGDGRLGFRHGSMTAFLAATYLIDRGVSRTQLESLFLVAAPDGSQTVPTNLRETAAWLVTMQPKHASWLVRADPESLVGHSQLVDSPEVRALLVDSLLARAGEIELNYQPWFRARRRLDHPGLSEQLLAVLGPAGASEPSNWDERSRVTLAIRLAREARAVGLSDPLLRITESDKWSAHLRSLAAVTAAEVDYEGIYGSLREVLSRYEDPTYGPTVDADEDLLGTLLQILFPAYLTTAEAMRFVHARRRRNLMGSYMGFLHDFPALVPDVDLAEALEWVVGRQLLSEDAEEGAVGSHIHEQVISQPDDPASADIDEEVVAGLIDRASISDSAMQLVDAMARLLDKQLRSFARPPLPLGTVQCDEAGVLSGEAVALSRVLARQLVRVANAHSDGFDGTDAYNLLQGWGSPDPWIRRRVMPGGGAVDNRTTLLRSSDLEWIYEQAADAVGLEDAKLAEAFAQLVPFVVDYPNDDDALAFIYERVEHPASTQVRQWFEPIPLDSDYARRWRDMVARRRAQEARAPSRNVDELIGGWLSDLSRAKEGDPEAFWRLAWNLQQDPATGNGRAFATDDLRQFPGTIALGPDVLEDLVLAAEAYLESEHDHRESWLGSNYWDGHAFAGYVALALMARENGLSRLSVDVWERWVGACLWSPFSSSESDEARSLRRGLLERCVEHAAAATEAAVLTVARGELARGQALYEIEDVPFSASDGLISVGLQLVSEFVAAWKTTTFDGTVVERDDREKVMAPDRVTFPRTAEAKSQCLFGWDHLIGALAASAPGSTTAAVDQLWSTAGGDTRVLAVRASAILIRTGTVEGAWTRYVLGSADEAGAGDGVRDLVLEVARTRRESVPFQHLDEEQLASSYEALRSLFPPHRDAVEEEAHWVSPEEDAWHLRDDFLGALAERATSAAMAQLARLVAAHPDDLRVTAAALRGRRAIFANAWLPPKVNELEELFSNAARRLVRSEDELVVLLTEILSAVEHDAKAHGELLWDRLPGRLLGAAEDLWLPKPEAAFAAYVAHELVLRLEGRGLAVNREILVRPTNPYGAGDRTDIVVEATVREDPILGVVPARLAVVIELKGCWNPGLLEDQRVQLADRYLPEASSSSGIYLVAWFPVEEWTATGDYRLKIAEALSRPEVERTLANQALDDGLAPSISLTPIHVTIHRPSPQITAAKKTAAKKTAAKKTAAPEVPPGAYAAAKAAGPKQPPRKRAAGKNTDPRTS